MAFSLFQQLINWGIKEEDIQVENKDSKLFVRKTMAAQKEGISFKVTLEAQTDNDGSFNGIGMYPMESLSTTWKLRIIYFIENPHGIEMSLKKESLGNKIGKFFGKNDLEVYNDLFDKTFLIESNHKYAYATILNENIQDKLLKHSKCFSQYLVKDKQVRAVISSESDDLGAKEKKFIDLMEIGLILAKNSQNWKSPK